MKLNKIIIKNYKSLRDVTLELNPEINIIVGDNEMGKSTLLEAIHLALTSQINGHSILNQLDPYLFNYSCVNEYFCGLREGKKFAPPEILIEAYFEDDMQLAKLKGTNNSLREDCPGVALRVEFNEEYGDEYSSYIQDPERIKTLPVEYYAVKWYSFAHNALTVRSMPVGSTLIDTSMLNAGSSAQRYILKIMGEVLEQKHRVDLSISYRNLKDTFIGDPGVKLVNNHLELRKGDITDKKLTVSMDLSAKSTWESGLTPHLDEIPFLHVGRGEQSTVKMKLALEASNESHVFLIEEPENHLSYTNMHNLIDKIRTKANGKQVIVTTHSSFVLNKLGVDNVILFNRSNSMRLDDLDSDTKAYFMKLPGHDTLRLILSQKAILVEGPSDELIVQKAFMKMHKKSPLECHVDIISVKSLAFKRFLNIARLLNLEVHVVTDNDGNVEQLENKYRDYLSIDNIHIHYDEDQDYPTLEPQMFKANGLTLLNQILDKNFRTQDKLLAHMENNKTDCALQIFESTLEIDYPEYINDAIR